MTELTLALAWIAPMSIVAGAAWRIATKLGNLDQRLERLEHDNGTLRIEVNSLRTLLTLIVDNRRNDA